MTKPSRPLVTIGDEVLVQYGRYRGKRAHIKTQGVDPWMWFLTLDRVTFEDPSMGIEVGDEVVFCIHRAQFTKI